MRPKIMACIAEEAADCVVMCRNGSPMSHSPPAQVPSQHPALIRSTACHGDSAALVFPADIRCNAIIKISGCLESSKTCNVCSD